MSRLLRAFSCHWWKTVLTSLLFCPRTVGIWSCAHHRLPARPKGGVEGRAERKRTWGGGRAGSVLEEQIERAFELATARYRYLAVNWLGQRNLRASGERALSFSMVGANQQTLDISVFLLPLRYSLNLHAFRTRLLFALVSPPKIPARIGRGFASPGGLRKIVDKIYYIHVRSFHRKEADRQRFCPAQPACAQQRPCLLTHGTR